MNLESILVKNFGFNHFRPGQKEIISSLIEKKDTIGVLPTGTGKTLCYQFIGHIFEGPVLIVSPLLSLMQDQVEQMKAMGEKRVVAINSFLTSSQKGTVLHSLTKYKYIFISPEMLQVEFVLQKLLELRLALFVVDEAHCISQWGYDFRTDYLKLGEIRKKLRNPLTLALTATATQEVMKDIIRILEIPQAEIFVSSVDRPNIALKIEKNVDTKAKQNAVITYLQKLTGPGIIYFSSKKLAEQMVVILKANGISKVMAYHGGMTQEDRILIQQQFIHGQIDYICATSAFGMGINKENIRFVIHFHMPLQMESYLQEIGRSGRDGKQSIAILLYAKGDENLALQLAENELPSPTQLDWLLDEVKHYRRSDDLKLGLTEELRLLGGFTDIQWRVTSDFILSQIVHNENIELTINNLKSFVTSRKNLKIKKIFEIVSYIYSSECRRNVILSYFGESLPRTNNPNCCDQCGMDVNEFLKKTDIEVNDERNNNWEWQLTQLLTSVKNKNMDA